MTFFAFFFFFLVSSCSSVDPTGLKVRITDRAHNVLREFGLEYLKEFLNKPLAAFTLGGTLNCEVKGLTFTSLTVRPENLNLIFQQNSGLRFQIKDLIFTAHLQRDINVCLFKQFRLDSRAAVLGGSGLSATIDVRLRNQQGRLNADIPNCEFNAENIMITSEGILGPLLDLLRPIVKRKLNSQACESIRTDGASKVNALLSGLSMETPLVADRGISIDYSLSGDVAVTSSSIDVPFKGLVFFGADRNNDIAGKDPVFTGSDRMAYVGVSDIFFKSSAQAIFRAGAFQMETEDIKKIIQLVMDKVGIPTGLVELELSEVPTVSISSSGVSIQAAGTIRSAEKPQEVFPLNCKIDIKVEIQGDRLFLLLNEKPKCDVKPKKFFGKILKPIVKSKVQSKIKDFMKSSFTDGLKIPLPEGLNFNGEVTYQDGFVVFGGDLRLAPSGAQAMVNKSSGSSLIQLWSICLTDLGHDLCLCCGEKVERPRAPHEDI